MPEHTHCDNPDRDNQRLVCGYPLPCPWHTAILHADKEPPTVEIPLTAKRALRARGLLGEILEGLRGRDD